MFFIDIEVARSLLKTQYITERNNGFVDCQREKNTASVL
jgi:hypothetical protein